MRYYKTLLFPLPIDGVKVSPGHKVGYTFSNTIPGFFFSSKEEIVSPNGLKLLVKGGFLFHLCFIGMRLQMFWHVFVSTLAGTIQSKLHVLQTQQARNSIHHRIDHLYVFLVSLYAFFASFTTMALFYMHILCGILLAVEKDAWGRREGRLTCPWS